MTSERQELNVKIRWLTKPDIAEVFEIERKNPEFSWQIDDFHYYREKRTCSCYVAERDRGILGFVFYELRGRKIEVLKLAVNPGFLRKGIGGQLIRRLVDKLSPNRYLELSIKVRESNLVAQLFLQSQGFRATKILTGYFSETGEDAYVMSCGIE